jgi:heat shock protein HtpX
MVMISIVLSLLGVNGYLTAQGINYQALLVICLVWGFAGSFISLAMSRWMAKMAMGVRLVDPGNVQLQWLVAMVHDLAKKAGLPAMPEVGVYESDDVNAFATGPTKSRSLVAFSSGILRAMNREQLEGVVGHELSHIANGDMVTMVLIQGVINAFVMFFARIVAFAASRSVDEKYSYVVHILTVIVCQIAFGILGSVVVCWFSRQREFRADAGSATLNGSQPMIAGLERLLSMQGRGAEGALPASMAALGISSKPSGFLALLSTHPPLEVRIEALKKYAVN